MLINGAGGGSGSFAIQLAKRLGAHVTGVDNAAKLDFMRSVGADDVIDYRREDFARTSQPYDLILDLVAHRLGVRLPARAGARRDLSVRRRVGARGAARAHRRLDGGAAHRSLDRGARRQAGPGPLRAACRSLRCRGGEGSTSTVRSRSTRFPPPSPMSVRAALWARLLSASLDANPSYLGAGPDATRSQHPRRVRRLHGRGPATAGRCAGAVGRGARHPPGPPPRLPRRAGAPGRVGRQRAVRRAERPVTSRDVDLRLRRGRGRTALGRRPVRHGRAARLRRDGVVGPRPARSPSRSPTDRSATAARCPTTDDARGFSRLLVPSA